jgi:hypothetical protein
MKTPRKILLDRHSQKVPALDAMRKQILSGTTLSASGPVFCPVQMRWPVRVLQNVWNELVCPARRMWAGLAAVWVVIVIGNLAQKDPDDRVLAKAPPVSTQQLSAWRAQQRQLADLNGVLAERTHGERSKSAAPKPRTCGDVERWSFV